MKRINNKGAILLETLIVSVFIMAIFMLVYQNTVPLMGQYEKLESFDDIDSVYAANLIKNMVTENISTYLTENLLLSKGYYNISDCNGTVNSKNIYSNPDYCNKVKNSLKIEGNDIIYIVHYTEDALNNFKNDIKNSGQFNSGELEDFIVYLDTVGVNEEFYDPDSDTNEIRGKYRIFISRTVYMMDGTRLKKFANIGIYNN